jgi:hypothetical protein
MITEHSVDDFLLQFNSENLLQAITAFQHALDVIKDTDIKRDLWKINQQCAETIDALYHSPNLQSTAAMIPLFWSNFKYMTEYAHISGIETRVMRARIMFLTLRAHIWVQHVAENATKPDGLPWASGLMDKISNALNKRFGDTRMLLLDSKLYLPELPSSVYHATLPRMNLNTEQNHTAAIHLTAQTIRHWLGFPPARKAIIQCSLLETLLFSNMTAILHLDIVWFMYLNPLSYIMQGVKGTHRNSGPYINEILLLFRNRLHQHPIAIPGTAENTHLCHLQSLVNNWTQQPFEVPVEAPNPPVVTKNPSKTKKSCGKVQDTLVCCNSDLLISKK